MSRIVQVANFVAPHSGGIRTVLDHLASGYAVHGHEVVRVVPGRRQRTVATQWGRQIEIAGPAIPRTGYRVMWFASVVRAVSAAEPDRLEVHDRSTLRGLGRWAGEHGVPSVVVSHERLDRLAGQWLPDIAAVRMLSDRSNLALATGFDTVVCTTEWAASEFRRLAVTNIEVIPLAVDLTMFRPVADADLRRRFSPDRAALLIMTSRMSREKRPDLAIDAVAELVRREVPVSLVVAGDGPMRRRLECRARGLPVTFVGHVGRAELARLLAVADVAVAPGPVETFGLAALEAMACGTPVVCNVRSALPQIVGATGGGVVAQATPRGFAEAVQCALARPPVQRRAAARATAERFSWARTVTGFLEAHRLPSESVYAA